MFSHDRRHSRPPRGCELADALYTLGRYEESEQWALRRLELGSRDDLATQDYGIGVRSRLLARNFAEVLYLTGDRARAEEMARRATEHYQRNATHARLHRDSYPREHEPTRSALPAGTMQAGRSEAELQWVSAS